MIILAAHCFWNKELTNRIIINDGTYRIAIGKYKRDITIMDNEYTQIVDVSNRHLKMIIWFGSLYILLKKTLGEIDLHERRI